MCTSSGSGFSRLSSAFTALELLVGLTLTVCLGLAIAPLALSLGKMATVEADRTITVLQGRVGVARLERDLRLASAGEAPFAADGPILEASPSQLVFLTRTGEDSSLELVEWELVAGSLMRRLGPCPDSRPTVFVHSLYGDHKTMAQGISRTGVFGYLIDGGPASPVLGQLDLGSIAAVVLSVDGEDEEGIWRDAVATVARVGR